MTIVDQGVDDARFEEEWDALADQLGAPPWLRPGWHRAWWAAFGTGTRDTVIVRDGTHLVGVLPVRRHLGVVSSPANWHTPEYGPLVRPEAAAEVARLLLERRPRRIELRFLDVNRPGFAELAAAATSANYRQIARVIERAPYIDTAPGWQRYESTRDTKMLRELRRRRRRLDAAGDVSFEVLPGTDRLDALLQDGFRVEAAGWKGDEHTAITSQPSTERFYTDVARWAAERGMLRLGFLRLDGTAIAFDLAIDDGGRHYLLKTGFDPAFRQFSPGLVLRHFMIERAFDHGMVSYEFLGADAPWKQQWTDTTRDRMLLQAFAPTATGIVDWSAYAVGRPLAKRALAVGRR